jgi:hypothetical protein
MPVRTGLTAAGTPTIAVVIHFVDYALTLDLLENELIDSLSAGGIGTPQGLPLRSYYLPTASSLVDLNSRICAGGPLALFAIARSQRSRKGGSPDYALLIQEWSAHVLNSARRLAVIPKAFHQPLVDFSDEAQLSATIERELEEELFGRPEVDSTLCEQRLADPMHEGSLSAPMRWLMEHADQKAWRIECVGFGINSVTGCLRLRASSSLMMRPGGTVSVDQFGLTGKLKACAGTLASIRIF